MHGWEAALRWQDEGRLQYLAVNDVVMMKCFLE